MINPIFLLLLGFIILGTLIYIIYYINYILIDTRYLIDYHHITPSQLEDTANINSIEEFRGIQTYPNTSWWNNRWAYTYLTPRSPPVIYTYSWYNPWFWFSPICKNGCTQTSVGQWGCQFPGNQPNDCIFASDCRGC